MNNKIIILCIEGERNVTEFTFFNKIADSSRKLFENLEINFISFDYSISEKNKKSIVNFFKVIPSKNNCKFFVIHDDDSEENKKSLNETYDFINDFLKRKGNYEIVRIFEKNKSFDYFLYYILNDESNPKSHDIKKFIKDNEFKKRENKCEIYYMKKQV